ncbi:MAG: sensor histidine kinase [Eubacteriales bacterium]|nr:sensor histidine kinase [Eubacteriales bacterium]
MSVWQYLKDKIMDILVYLAAAGIVYVMGYLDASLRMLPDNINYLVIILLTAGTVYLIIDYFVKSSQFHKVASLDAEKACLEMPPPKDTKELRYQKLIREIIEKSAEEAARKERDNQEEIEFLTLLAHRMKTPVTAIGLIADKTAFEGKNELKNELFRLQEDVDKMLYYARGRDFSNDYVIESANLGTIVSASVKKHARLFIGKGIGIRQDNLDLFVLTDKKGLGFIFDQLISNAVKYSHGGGTIYIFAQENNNEVSVTVRDSGVGIGKDDLPRVLNRSFTGNNGRLNTNATGMGLYLADKMAKKLGHRLSIQSTKGTGTEATVFIPKFTDSFK